MNNDSGFSLLEVIIAVAICAILVATLSTASTGSLRHTRTGNQRTQAVQILDTIGRRVASGDHMMLPKSGESIEFDYGELAGMHQSEGASHTESYRAAIVRGEVLTVGESRTARYHIEVCFRTGGEESCVRGVTLGIDRSSA